MLHADIDAPVRGQSLGILLAADALDRRPTRLPVTGTRVVDAARERADDRRRREPAGEHGPRAEGVAAAMPAADEIEIVTPVLPGRVARTDRIRACAHRVGVREPAAEVTAVQLAEQHIDPVRVAAAAKK